MLAHISFRFRSTFWHIAIDSFAFAVEMRTAAKAFRLSAYHNSVEFLDNFHVCAIAQIPARRKRSREETGGKKKQQIIEWEQRMKAVQVAVFPQHMLYYRNNKPTE